MPEPTLTKLCAGCRKELPLAEFPCWPSRGNHPASRCRPCTRQQNRRARRRPRPTPSVKVCPGCRQEVPASAFWKNKSRADGLADRCKSCASADHRAAYARDIEASRAQRKGHYWEHRDRELLQSKKSYQRHRQKRLAQAKALRLAHPEVGRAKSHAYYLRHHDEQIAYGKAYRRTERGRAVLRKASAKEREIHRDHRRARIAINNALRDGRIGKSDACEHCGAEGRIESHHYLGYEQEHWFDIEWLCLRCHKAADKLSA